MGSALSVPLNSARSWTTTLRNNGVALEFDGDADTLDAKVFAGDGDLVLFTPAVEWVDATGGTVRLGVSAGQTATLTPGAYRLQVAVTVAGSRSVAYDGTLDITGGPGSGAAGQAWCSYSDMLLYFSQLPSLAGPRSSATAGFQAEREEATEVVARMIVERYDPQPGFCKTRRPKGDEHPQLGRDVYDPTALAPDQHEVSGYLASGGLIPERKVREIVALMAIARVLERQSVSAGKDGYREEAAFQRQSAAGLFGAYWAQIDTDDDGVADLLVHRNVIFLPEGTAP